MNSFFQEKMSSIFGIDSWKPAMNIKYVWCFDENNWKVTEVENYKFRTACNVNDLFGELLVVSFELTSSKSNQTQICNDNDNWIEAF